MASLSRDLSSRLLKCCNDQEASRIEGLRENAVRNGVHDLEILDEHAIRALEPEVQGVAGIFSPSTGIIDSHALCRALAADARASGADIVLKSPSPIIKVSADSTILNREIFF